MRPPPQAIDDHAARMPVLAPGFTTVAVSAAATVWQKR
jgi:hypothetical protein